MSDPPPSGGRALEISSRLFMMRNLFELRDDGGGEAQGPYAGVPAPRRSLELTCRSCRREGNVRSAIAECDVCGSPVCGEHHLQAEGIAMPTESPYLPALVEARGPPLRLCRECLEDEG